MNITDVGHLESDADEGGDKVALAATQERRSVEDLTRFYEQAFFSDCQKINILQPTIICRATEHILDMIALVKRLLDRGYAYVGRSLPPPSRILS
jgi:cysteinyl-tRNA synthetase